MTWLHSIDALLIFQAKMILFETQEWLVLKAIKYHIFDQGFVLVQ